MKINKLVLLIMSCMIFMSSIGYTRYKSAPLQKISKVKKSKKNGPVVTAEEYISFDYKVFKVKDCKKYFNSKNIIKNGYQPIQITFTNNSKYSIALSLEDFSFPLVSTEEVACSLHRNGAYRGAGFGAGAFFCPILIVPACVQGFGAEAYNEQMDNDFLRKEWKEQVISPYKNINAVAFVDVNDFNKDFTFTVKDSETKQLFKLSSNKRKLIV